MAAALNYAAALNDLQSKISPNVTIWSMPAPTASPSTRRRMHWNTLPIRPNASTASPLLNSGIQSVNVVDVMKKHTEENIYLRTDHHWQPLGAYYAARTFAEAAGVPFCRSLHLREGREHGLCRHAVRLLAGLPLEK